MATMMATRTRSCGKGRKPAYKPLVQKIDAAKGLYAVQSKTYKYVLYLVDAVNGRCECTASAQFGKACSHIKAARLVHEFRTVAYASVAIPAFTPAAVQPELVAKHGGAAGLMEAFGS